MNNSLELNEQIEFTVKQYNSSIQKYAFTYVKNRSDAEDITQNVFAAYFCKAPRFDSEEHKKAWLFKVTGNMCKSYLKSAWKRHRVSLSEELSYLPKEKSGLIDQVLSLDEKYRVPVHLYYYEGYSIKEIAKILGRNEATVNTWLNRGRGLLKIKIEREES